MSQASQLRDETRERLLLKGLATHLERCFEQLVLDYQERLYAFALRLTGNREEAQEIVQDAFIRVYHALATYEAEQIRTLALRPWLYQVTLNVSRNRRRRKQPPQISLEALECDPELEPTSAASEQPEAIAEVRERQQILQQLLLSLPERYRAAVILRHIEGLDYHELAATLQQPPGTIKSHVHRGSALLRQALLALQAKEELS